MAEQSSSSRARELGNELRFLRGESKRTSANAAVTVGISPSKLSRLENGLRGAKYADVVSLLDLYGVNGPKRTRLLELATGMPGTSRRLGVARR